MLKHNKNTRQYPPDLTYPEVDVTDFQFKIKGLSPEASNLPLISEERKLNDYKLSSYPLIRTNYGV